jgi:uncharacterized protein (DUF433 family)
MNNPLIILNENSLKSGVFYGSININGTHITVSNLAELGKEYRFRYTGKARAGFPIIADTECTIENLPYYLSKNTTVVQMEKMIGGKPYWFNILTTKGGKWTSIDKNLLESLEVGDMHGCFPKMIDWNIWKAMNTKFHSCKAFVNNK